MKITNANPFDIGSQSIALLILSLIVSLLLICQVDSYSWSPVSDWWNFNLVIVEVKIQLDHDSVPFSNFRDFLSYQWRSASNRDITSIYVGGNQFNYTFNLYCKFCKPMEFTKSKYMSLWMENSISNDDTLNKTVVEWIFFNQSPHAFTI